MLFFGTRVLLPLPAVSAVVVFARPLGTFSFSFSLPRRNPDLGLLGRLFSPLQYVPSFFSREGYSTFFPSSTRVARTSVFSRALLLLGLLLASHLPIAGIFARGRDNVKRVKCVCVFCVALLFGACFSLGYSKGKI